MHSFKSSVKYLLCIISLSLSLSVSGETTSLTEQIRAGGLRPALELGVTPSHVSLAAAQSVQSIQSAQSSSLPGDLHLEEELGEGVELSEDGIEGHLYGDGVYCIPLESVGLGGNQITSVGAAALADGLKSNTSECTCTCIGTMNHKVFIVKIKQFWTAWAM